MVCTRSEALKRRLRSSRKLRVRWQANQSQETVSINRRTRVNNDCGTVGAVGKVSGCQDRWSVTAAGSTPVLVLALVLCSASTACGGQRTLRRYTGQEMRTHNQVATADGLAESGWGLALCEFCLRNRAFLLKFQNLKLNRFFIF